MNSKSSILIKPLIHPPIIEDESPLGYLIRLAELNEYDSYSWLFNPKANIRGKKSSITLYEYLSNTSWTKCNEDNSNLIKTNQLSKGCSMAGKIRFCPLCLNESGYIREHWQYRVSVVCSKHKVWLHDHCDKCKTDIASNKSKTRECKCGQELGNIEVTPAPSEAVMMQRFLEGAYSSDCEDALVLSANNGLSFKERVEILGFFSRWLKDRQMTTSGVSRNLKEMKTARQCMSDVAEALFVGQTGFHNFLKRLNEISNLPSNKNYKIPVFTKFYRAFYKNFNKTCFQPYKDYIETFINKYWQESLTARNKNFSEKTILNHPWIPLQQACREYDIPKSTLKKAMVSNLIKSKLLKKTSRTYTMLYKPDLEDRVGRLKSMITAKESALILGVTKSQFRKLNENGCFDFAISPEDSKSQTWMFLRDEICSFRDKYIKAKSRVKSETWSLPQVLRFFGGKFNEPLSTIMKAIDQEELKIIAVNEDSHGLSSILFDKKEFLQWYQNLKDNSSGLTIPKASKTLGLNQEFTYQLVNKGLIETEEASKGNTRIINQDSITEFSSTYVVLSKLAKKIQVSSRTLIKYLSSKEVYPIDFTWNDPLRQKVYKKSHLENISLLTGAI